MNHNTARLTAAASDTPKGPRRRTIPPSRTPMPFKLMGNMVMSVIMGTATT